MGSAGSKNLYTLSKKPLASYLTKGMKEEIQKGLYMEFLPCDLVEYLNLSFPG